MSPDPRPTSELDRIREQQRDTWDRFSAGWKQWDSIVVEWMAPCSEAMLRLVQLREDSQVLDIAAGTGEPGLTAAARAPRGHVTITDLAERMLTVAAENAAVRGLKNVSTRACDAGALPFAEASFDAVLCRFGFMFFPEMSHAVRELARVARPGARVCAAVWGAPQKNEWATTVMDAISRRVSLPAPPPGAPGLFRCAPPGVMRQLFEQAGFTDIAEEEVPFELRLASPERYWDFMNDISAPVVAGLAGADERTRTEVRADVLERARVASSAPGAVHLCSAAVAIVGTRPASRS